MERKSLSPAPVSVSSCSRYRFRRLWRAGLVWLTAACGVKRGPGTCRKVWQDQVRLWTLMHIWYSSDTTSRAHQINRMPLIHKSQATFCPFLFFVASWELSNWRPPRVIVFFFPHLMSALLLHRTEPHYSFVLFFYEKADFTPPLFFLLAVAFLSARTLSVFLYYSPQL